MNGIISNATLKKIASFRKHLLRLATWVIIGGVAAGIAVIFLVDKSELGDILGKMVATIISIALVLMVSVNGFAILEARKAAAQIFAIATMVTSLAWLALWMFAIWGNIYENDLMTKAMLICAILAVWGFYIANMLNLFEGRRRDVLQPLRIVGILAATYATGYFCAFILCGPFDGDLNNKLQILAWFGVIIGIIILPVAAVISKNERKYTARLVEAKNANHIVHASRQHAAPTLDLSKYSDKVPPEIPIVEDEPSVQPGRKMKIGPSRGMDTSVSSPRKTEAELRAEVEEEIRRETIEKELRAKLSSQRNADGAYTDDPEAADPYPKETYDDYAQDADDEEYLLNPFGVKQATAAQEDEDIINAVNELNEYIDDKGQYKSED